MIEKFKEINKQALSLCLLASVMASCTKGPDQYDRSAPKAANQGDIEITDVTPDEPNIMQREEAEEVEDIDARDRRAITLSKMDVIYGIGLAGIDIGMTKEEVAPLLTEPEHTVEIDWAVVDVHREGFNIFWTKTVPKRINIIYVNKNYLGSLDAGEGIGRLGIHTDVAKFFDDESPKGEKLITKMYKNLEGKDVDCIEKGLCKITEDAAEGSLTFELPKMMMFISIEKKIVYEFLLKNEQDSGLLENPFDLLDGKFSFWKNDLNGEFDIVNTVAVGENFNDVNEKLGRPANNTEVFTKSVKKTYGSVSLYFKKNQFTRDILDAQVEDQLTGISVYGTYKKPVMANGKYITFDLVEDKYTFSSVSNYKKENDSAYLTLKNKLNEGAGVQFLESLTSFVQEEAIKLDPENTKVFVVERDKHKAVGSRFLTNVFYIVNTKTNDVKLVNFTLAERSNQIIGFGAEKFTETAANARVIPTLDKEINISEAVTTLSGVSLGDEVTINDIDFAREEATITLDEKEYRVGYSESSILRTLGKNNVGELKNSYELVSLPELLPSVYLEKTEEGKHKVVGINSANIFGNINITCGDKTLTTKINGSAKKLEDDLKTLIKEDGTKACDFVSVRESSGRNLLSHVHFKEYGIKIIVNEAAVSVIQVYKTTGGNK